MTLMKTNELLKFAEAHKFGVPAINVFNYESVKFAIMAAEEAKMPIIIQYFPGFEGHCPLDEMCSIIMKEALKAKVPVAIHLDHSRGFDIAARGLAAGFPSVMIDGSSLPYEENIAVTKQTSDIAHAMGVDVEAELGHVGAGSKLEDFTNPANFTDPAQAVDFVKRTGCDSLAVSVGNAHGNYVKSPDLKFDLIKELRAALDIPLVMHGGSDIPYDQMQEAVQLGMSKFNIATEYQRCFYRTSKAFYEKNERPDMYYANLRDLERPCIDFVKAKIDMLNPNHFSL